ncbi:uncharacterized protein MONBRDRAFT_27442 [Monosiga brevicollis MX1]|uniref:Bifunctional lysine-specific demethylase and histidyl-hydroxylase n=1 Tax=Monosiga brevicollis TaxID=81824 RepID=A9V5A3_MONBE|nr:uncharacterized protein MONBRDRAFT_27442 [Monosiga brevicollis MX1]EDQ87242.1 predicted protein [Monosiga brevicollis MX1]|eukprot:XP_001747855.1 hypothetical protein [Monosiga brevicollis MX1]
MATVSDTNSNNMPPAADSQPTTKQTVSSVVNTEPAGQPAPKREKRPAMPRTLGDILAPMTTQQFFDKHFERSFLYIPREDRDPGIVYQGLFSLDQLYTLLQRESMFYGTDLNLCRYDGERKLVLNGGRNDTTDLPTINGNHSNSQRAEEQDSNDSDDSDELAEEALAADVRRRVEDLKATVQFHQPQRFVRALHDLLYSFEQELTTLVGANVYITPANSQGLAPHHDDVEVYILQLEGEKAWRLYEPIEPLAMSYSADLDREELAQPIAELVLRPGDFLYLPRGTIHEASCVGNQHSTHITISSHQNWNYGHLMAQTLPECITNAMSNVLELRRGLPHGFLRQHGVLHAGFPPPPSAVFHHMRELLQSDQVWSEIERHFHQAVDSFALDYTTARLPPPALRRNPLNPAPTRVTPVFHATTKVRLVYTDHIRALPTPGAESNDDGQADDQPDFEIKVWHSLSNDVRTHMMQPALPDSEDEDDEHEEQDEEEEDTACSRSGLRESNDTGDVSSHDSSSATSSHLRSNPPLHPIGAVVPRDNPITLPGSAWPTLIHLMQLDGQGQRRTSAIQAIPGELQENILLCEQLWQKRLLVIEA